MRCQSALERPGLEACTPAPRPICPVRVTNSKIRIITPSKSINVSILVGIQGLCVVFMGKALIQGQ